MPYELFIGLRYLRAKRRDAFISLITLISTIGVAIGVMTLNIVLAVMTGFEEDLRDRILRFSPHVLVWSETGPVEGHVALLDRLRELLSRKDLEAALAAMNESGTHQWDEVRRDLDL